MVKGLTEGCPYELREKYLEGKGRAVFLRSDCAKKDSFVIEYEGDVITMKQAIQREKIYILNGEGCYLFNFAYKEKTFVMDATRKFKSYARLLNHSKKPNCKLHPPITDVDTGLPRLAIYALRDIQRNEELTIDYGIRRKSLGWLNCEEGAMLNSIDFQDEAEDIQTPGNISFVHFDPEPRNPTQEEMTDFWLQPDIPRGTVLEHKCQLPEFREKTKITNKQWKSLFKVFRPAISDTEITEDEVLEILKREDNTLVLVTMLKAGLSIDDIRLAVNEMCFHRDAITLMS